jgi:thioredoxin 1
MEEDKELERIRQMKLKQLITKSAKKTTNEVNQEKKAPNKPIEVTDTTFQETIQNYPLVVIDCWAPWCGPCHMVAPIVEEMAHDFSGKILFGKLNVDKNRKVTMQYRIMSIPTLLVFKNGRLVDQIVGAMPRKMLEPKITCYLE